MLADSKIFNAVGFKLYRDLVFSQGDREKSKQILKKLNIFDISPTMIKGFEVKPYLPPSPFATSRFFSTSSANAPKPPSLLKVPKTSPGQFAVYDVEQTMSRINAALAKIASTPLYDSIQDERKKALVEVDNLQKKRSKPSLPPLPVNVKDLLREARSKPEHTVIAEAFNIPIGPKEFKKLVSPQWLNDEIINAYLLMIQKRSEDTSRKLPSIHAFNTHFYTTLCERGYEGVQRWTRKTDLFSKDLVLVPIHLGMHWVLSMIDFRRKQVRYLDSLHGRNERALNTLRQYLEKEHLDKKKAPFNSTGWTFKCEMDCPAQQNGFDCGVFTCINAEYISRDEDLTFGQKDMLYFRDKIAYELLSESLLV